MLMYHVHSMCLFMISILLAITPTEVIQNYFKMSLKLGYSSLHFLMIDLTVGTCRCHEPFPHRWPWTSGNSGTGLASIISYYVIFGHIFNWHWAFQCLRHTERRARCTHSGQHSENLQNKRNVLHKIEVFCHYGDLQHIIVYLILTYRHKVLQQIYFKLYNELATF